MSKPKYAQCTFQQQRADSMAFDVAYLPIKYCRVGKVIRIDSLPGLWTVTSVGAVRDKAYADGLFEQRKYFERALENA